MHLADGPRRAVQRAFSLLVSFLLRRMCTTALLRPVSSRGMTAARDRFLSSQAGRFCRWTLTRWEPWGNIGLRWPWSKTATGAKR